ncbi:hypothetical protein CFK37_17830 [Virgibacillus phasianinus]|uniref:Tubby C-terminal domain-containing protein n=1 Tax=Virgibacillus phasianinus TaxID=2017483 RepID=A0A220U761_9BACI|nr:hypothetical protein [Virgibacillus phasianinus]ASK63885.1 hypothetical protein CFK37_17830 [Virgibacillus phasianinus]
MYEYRFYNTISTKASSVYDENTNEIGTITKKYANPIQKIGDILLNGRFFVNYELKNTNHQVVFQSKKELNPLKRRQYYINYSQNDTDYSVHLVDKKSFNVGQNTTFTFNEETYELEQAVMDWARIKKDGSIVAEWKSSLKPPFKAYFNLIDKEYENDILFLLGIFHTYLHAA